MHITVIGFVLIFVFICLCRNFFRYCFVAIQIALSLVISIVLLPKHPIPTVVALGLVLSILGKHPTYSDIMLWMVRLHRMNVPTADSSEAILNCMILICINLLESCLYP